MEVSPPFDVNNMTSLVAATIAFEILCTMTKVIKITNNFQIKNYS